MTHVLKAARTNAAFEPYPAGTADLTYAGFVLVPKLHLATACVFAGDLLQPFGEGFLKRARAAGSTFGWLGRVFW